MIRQLILPQAVVKGNDAPETHYISSDPHVFTFFFFFLHLLIFKTKILVSKL